MENLSEDDSESDSLEEGNHNQDEAQSESSLSNGNEAKNVSVDLEDLTNRSIDSAGKGDISH